MATKTIKSSKPPKLPQLIDRKIYKTGQTRGSDDDEIFQNRVSRSSTVLVPLAHWNVCATPADGSSDYASSAIVLISPSWYMKQADPEKELKSQGLSLGVNAVIFYEDRKDWEILSPESKGWKPATSRTNPLGGQFVARISANTATTGGGKISEGFNTTSMKGAGIRVYEYASPQTIDACRIQLESIMWLCRDAEEKLVQMGMSHVEVALRKSWALDTARNSGLLELEKLMEQRIINSEGFACCPLCLEELSALGFGSRLVQAAGREVADLTVTEISLFHIRELRVGELGHKPYNLGWGHHHCNVVAKDSGIRETLTWLKELVARNHAAGFEF
ncbi:MAG: hypothetical protein RJA33_298 [Actinomycetota bacterium]|jgi:hypothetical protein